MSRYVIVLSHTPSPFLLNNIGYALSLYGIHNTLYVFQVKSEVKMINGLIIHDNKVPDIKRLYINLEDDVWFPDLLKGNEGYVYRVVFYTQLPYVKFDSKGIRNENVHFIKEVAKKQRARTKFLYLKKHTDLKSYFFNRRMDLSLNTGIRTKRLTTLQTYKELATCAMVPKLNQGSIFKFLLVQPFNWKIWLAFFTTLFVFAVTWRLFKGRGAIDSVWRMMAGVMALFLSQSLNFRNNRCILVAILQVFFFFAMFLGGLYQGEFLKFPFLKSRS